MTKLQLIILRCLRQDLINFGKIRYYHFKAQLQGTESRSEMIN